MLLHGFPGNEQNLDLAQVIRRAGWNVLTLHYRGAWGSPGSFSIGNVLQHADAAGAFVRRADIAENLPSTRIASCWAATAWEAWFPEVPITMAPQLATNGPPISAESCSWERHITALRLSV